LDVIAIVQARMGSTRLPGKVLKKINNKFILDYVIERLKFSDKINDVLNEGYRTYDIMAEGKKEVGTKEMGDLISGKIREGLLQAS